MMSEHKHLDAAEISCIVVLEERWQLKMRVKAPCIGHNKKLA
jgi:hypothetical protein